MKEIKPIFEARGKRQKLVGFEAIYNGFVVGIFDNRERARFELDRFAYEMARAA
jgi:hypothetical protein